MTTNFWGNLVRTLREEQSVSQRVLSARTGVCRTALRRLEISGQSADIAMVERLLYYLGYELDAVQRDSSTNVLTDQIIAETDKKQRARISSRRLMSI